MSDYIYLGDKLTDPQYKGAPCNAVRRSNGKCIRGRNGSMLVSFEGRPVNVIGRQLRKIKNTMNENQPTKTATKAWLKYYDQWLKDHPGAPALSSSHKTLFIEGFNAAYKLKQPESQQPGGPRWVKVGQRFPEDEYNAVFRNRVTGKYYANVEDFENEFLIFEGERVDYWRLEWLEDSRE